MPNFKFEIYRRREGSIDNDAVSNLYIKDIYLILFYILIVIFETTIMHNFEIYDASPNLMLVLTIIITMFFDRSTIIKSAIYAGLISDIFIGRGIGISIIAYLIVVFSILQFESKIFKDNYMTALVLIFFSTIFFEFYMFSIRIFNIIRDGIFVEFIIKGTISALYGMLFGFWLHRLVYKSIRGDDIK